MDKAEIIQQLRNFAGSKVPPNTLPAEEKFATAPISETLGLDSLDLVRFVVALENHFDVELPDEALIQVRTFDDLATAISEGKPLMADGVTI